MQRRPDESEDTISLSVKQIQKSDWLHFVYVVVNFPHLRLGPVMLPCYQYFLIPSNRMLLLSSINKALVSPSLTALNIYKFTEEFQADTWILRAGLFVLVAQCYLQEPGKLSQSQEHLHGCLGLALVSALSAVVQGIDEAEYGGTWELTKEGFLSGAACFLVM